GTRLTVALTNRNKGLPKGPAHKRATGGGGGLRGRRGRTLLRAEDCPHTKLTFDFSPSASGLDLLFWASLTQLARPQTPTMFPVKVKVEKSELEMAKARNQLDAVLQCLLEKSHMDSVWMRKLGRPPQTPTTRIAPSRPAANDSYVIKLFDRSVDLAQFSENTPLYPICRAWMRNSPTVRERERSPSSPLPPLPEDEEGSEVTNSKSRDVYKLPPPTAPGPPGDACRSRIPSPLQPETQGTPDDEPSEPEPSPSALIYRNMQRWKRIRQRWKEASHRNQLRYSESMKILREMYERQ
ncbi:hypothetical protein E2I00_015256, partial [Balaenoptera physalus]